MGQGFIPLSQIDDNPWQSRVVYEAEALEELAADIRAHGLLQPPVGRVVDKKGEVLDPEDNDVLQATMFPKSIVTSLGRLKGADVRVQIAFGHRRLRAMKANAAQDGVELDRAVMAVELRYLTNEKMAQLAWSENAKRRDLSPIEAAQAIERMVTDFRWTQEEVAQKLGVSRPTVSNRLRLLKLPADVQARVRAGEVSERQAMALVPLFDLPQACLHAYERDAGYHTKPAEVLRRAATYSSDELRREVDDLIGRATREINGHWSGHAFADRHVKAATCDACELKVKRGPVERCTSVTCHERKTGLWALERVAAASAATGIAGAPDEMSYSEYTGMVNVPHVGRVLEKGCANLRLRFHGQVGAAFVQAPGFPDVEIICLHGKDGRCTCGSTAKAAATRADPDIQAQKAAEKRIQAEIMEPSNAAVLAALQAGHLGVWRALVTGSRYSTRVPAEDATLAEMQGALAAAIAGGQDYGVRDRHDFGRWKQVREECLRALGVAVPWETSDLEKLARRWERIAGWIERREWWRYELEISCEAVMGNIANIEALLAEMAALPEDKAGGAADLVARAEAGLATLRRVGDVAPAVNADEAVSGSQRGRLARELAEAAPGSLALGRALGLASGPLVRYALAVCEGDEAREGELRRRLAEIEGKGASNG